MCMAAGSDKLALHTSYRLPCNVKLLTCLPGGFHAFEVASGALLGPSEAAVGSVVTGLVSMRESWLGRQTYW